MENIEAFHNYYPKPETGLSEAFFNQKKPLSARKWSQNFGFRTR
ncbi:MupG family TIM beta-alpha barrel fold protein [Listeria aquatica]|uniref:6-phospho-N-acetylmuramidase N-terminal domain-containing protein n=1 Tax=Listeria aquatica FSL S10-1188 TaxID=1265818 RepID=W7AUX4_9LIST|nr:MupG family TIM beta-alpha barrel fold protein [Listeria aquatica]EUJ17452.1 hypothetical protein MAQA_13276 [Listeria aquatica FSL S10-1188]